MPSNITIHRNKVDPHCMFILKLHLLLLKNRRRSLEECCFDKMPSTLKFNAMSSRTWASKSFLFNWWKLLYWKCFMLCLIKAYFLKTKGKLDVPPHISDFWDSFPSVMKHAVNLKNSCWITISLTNINFWYIKTS